MSKALIIKFLLLIFLWHLQFDLQAQGKLWGMTSNGGAHGAGVIFEYELSSGTFLKRHDFNGTDEGFGPQGALCLAPNGKLYGVTKRRGANDMGTLFEFDINTGQFTKKLDFDGANGSQPVAGMTLATNGKLYGTTENGGANGSGVLYEFDPATNTYSVKVNFIKVLGNYPISALTLGSNGKLYGTTLTGGSSSSDRGVIFEYDPSTNTYTKLYIYTGGTDGSFAWASVAEGLDGKLYGTMPDGGTSDLGHLYSFDLSTSTYSRVYDFTGWPNGTSPFGGRLCRASNGILYGLTDSGPQGTAGPGIIYSFDPASSAFKKEYTFQYDQTETGGFIDMFSGLVQVNDAKLYGMTTYGGLYGYGTLFEYDLQAKKYTALTIFGSVEGSSPGKCMLMLIPSRTQSIRFNSIPDKTYGDSPFTLTASSTTGLPVSYTSSDPAVATISGNTVTIIGPGTTTITAHQSGNANYDAAADVQRTLTVKKLDQSISFDIIPTKKYGDAPFTVTATSTSGLPVTFTSDNEEVATISGNTITIHQAGYANITSSQPGNSIYNAAFDYSQLLTVDHLPQSITFDPLPSKFFGDAPFQLSATASSGLPIVYRSTDESVATITGNTVHIHKVGITFITAMQWGDLNYASVGESQMLWVDQAFQTIFFFNLEPKSFGDAPFTLSAISTAGQPVTYMSSDPAVATVAGNTVTIKGVGTTTITATQEGSYDCCYAAIPVEQVLTVTKGTQTINFNTLPGKIFGDPSFMLTATATSALPVSFSSSNPAVATVSGNTVTITGSGTTTITATQLGNNNYAGATSIDRTLNVSKANQSITFNALPTKTFGNTYFALTATTTSGLPLSYSSSNPAVATVSGNTVTITGGGTATITATQTGNNNYNGASVQQLLTVNKASQNIQFDPLPAKNSGDPSFALTATSSSGLAVTYSSSNSGVATISGNTVSIIASGTAIITATQSGNSNYAAASPVTQTLVVTVPKITQTITFTSLPLKAFGDPPFLLNAKASSGLAVSYTSSNPLIAVVVGNKVTIKAPGTTTITAVQTGNPSYLAATPVEQVLTVDKATQQINFGGFPQNVSVGSAPFVLGASSNSGLPVTYASDNPSVAFMNGNTVNIAGPGWVKITVTQSGNALYKEAVPVSRDLYVNKKLQTIIFTSLSQRSTGDDPFSPEATASSGLPVTYTSSNHRVALIDNSFVKVVGAGTTVITASQPGNELFEPATPVNQTLVVSTITGLVETLNNGTFHVFPNPASSEITISTNDLKPDHSVRIIFYNSYGLEVLKFEAKNENELQIDLTSLASGSYWVDVVQGNVIKRARFVKL